LKTKSSGLGSLAFAAADSMSLLTVKRLMKYTTRLAWNALQVRRGPRTAFPKHCGQDIPALGWESGLLVIFPSAKSASKRGVTYSRPFSSWTGAEAPILFLTKISILAFPAAYYTPRGPAVNNNFAFGGGQVQDPRFRCQVSGSRVLALAPEA